MEGITRDIGIAMDIQDRCLNEMAYFKAPAYFIFVDNLPVTNTQKVTKVKIFPKNVDPRKVDGCIDLRSRKRKIKTKP